MKEKMDNHPFRGMGQRIRQARLDRCLTQTAFAKQLGWSQGYVNEMEIGRQGPSREVLMSLHNTYGISSDWILFGERNTDQSLDWFMDMARQLVNAARKLK